MSIIRPYTAQELALKDKIQESAEKAKLNLSETLALNKKFGLNLQYTPQKDVVEITGFIKKNAKKPDPFIEECMSEAKYYGGIILEKIRISSKGSFATNVENALKKLKQVL